MQLIVNEIYQTKDPEGQKEKRLEILKQLMNGSENLRKQTERTPDFTYKKTSAASSVCCKTADHAMQTGKCHG